MKRFKKIVSAIAVASMLLGLTACGSASKDTTEQTTETTTESNSTDADATAADALDLAFYDGTVYIGQSTWVGYAPLFIAQEKGFFEKYGADIQIQVIESAADRRSALLADQIHAMSSTVDTHIMTDAAGIDIVQVLALDTSDGGDGVVAVSDINSIADLQGKKVALDTTGGASFFWFQYLLREEGMTLDDLDVQSMGSGDAGSAFVAGNVDAAVTWEPWLTNAKSTDFGKVLMDSSETPGIIVDSIGMKKEFIDAYPGTVRALVLGWYDALAYIESDYDDAIAIMAEGMGQTPEEFEESLAGVTYYDRQMNIDYFDTSIENNIYDIAALANEIWIENGFYEEGDAPVIEEVIDGSFVGIE